MSTPEISVFERDATAEAVAAALENAGCTIIARRANDALMDCIEGELAPHLEATPYGPSEFLGGQTRRVANLFAKSTACAELALDDLVLGVADRLLLPSCVRYQMNYAGMIHLAPGAPAQELHRDGLLYPFHHPHPPTILAAMWAGDGFSAENGATRIAPGSHRWAHERAPTDAELVSAAMPRGSVLLYTSSVFHGGGANRSNGPRAGIALHYSLGWLRQEHNFYLELPPAIAKTLPEQLQRLIGYDLMAPYLNFIHQGNPHKLLEDDPDPAHERTTDELDAAGARVAPIPFGDGPAKG